MSQPFDGFGDIIQEQEGIFAGSEGLTAYDSVKRQYAPTGMVVEAHCEYDGGSRHVEISWPELIALKFDVSPHEAYASHPQLRQFAEPWTTTQGMAHKGVIYAWYPANLRCRCGRPFLRPLIQPTECEAHLLEMRRNSWMQPQVEQGLSQHCHNVARQLGRAR